MRKFILFLEKKKPEKINAAKSQEMSAAHVQQREENHFVFLRFDP